MLTKCLYALLSVIVKLVVVVWSTTPARGTVVDP